MKTSNLYLCQMTVTIGIKFAATLILFGCRATALKSDG